MVDDISKILIIPQIIFGVIFLFFFLYMINKRYFNNENYIRIKIKPSILMSEKGFLNKMEFFLTNAKSLPMTKGVHNLILDITNRGNNTSYSFIVPEKYKDDYLGIFVSNFKDFEYKLSRLNDKGFMNQYKGFTIFRSLSNTPFLKENDDEKSIKENINTIINGISEGSFQISLNFINNRPKTVATDDDVSDLKVGNNIAGAGKVGFVKDIGVSFRFLSFTNKFTPTIVPSLVGGILNLGGKLDLITKMKEGGSDFYSPSSVKNRFYDLLFKVFHTNKIRLSIFSKGDEVFFNAKEISSLYNFVENDKIDILEYKTYSPYKFINKGEQIIYERGYNFLSKKIEKESGKIFVKINKTHAYSDFEKNRDKYITDRDISEIMKSKYSDSDIINEGQQFFTKIGKFEYSGLTGDPYFQLEDKILRKHVYIIGKTGTGKTTMLKVFIKDDIEKGRGFAFIDPNGDVAKEILDFIPEERKQDVIYVDPSIFLGKVCLSAFSFIRELKKYQREFEQLKTSDIRKLEGLGDDIDDKSYSVISEDKFMSMIVNIIKSVSVGGSTMWGPRMDKIMKDTGSELLKYEMSEITDMSAYLNNPLFRKYIINGVENVDQKEALQVIDEKDEKEQDITFQPVRNRFDVFLNDTMKGIFSGNPKLSLREAMDTGKIIILRLPKGQIGDGNAQLLGSMMVGMFWAMAQTRISINETERKDFTIYIDEVQNFVTDTFAEILEEARKYRLRLVMANQFTKQIKHRNDKVYDSIKGNVGTLVALSLGADDSKELGEFFGIPPMYMANIPSLHAYVRCPDFANGIFNLELEFIKQNPKLNYPGADYLMKLSHDKYGIPLYRDKGKIKEKESINLRSYFEKHKNLPEKDVKKEDYEENGIEKEKEETNQTSFGDIEEKNTKRDENGFIDPMGEDNENEEVKDLGFDKTVEPDNNIEILDEVSLEDSIPDDIIGDIDIGEDLMDGVYEMPDLDSFSQDDDEDLFGESDLGENIQSEEDKEEETEEENKTEEDIIQEPISKEKVISEDVLDFNQKQIAKEVLVKGKFIIYTFVKNDIYGTVDDIAKKMGFNNYSLFYSKLQKLQNLIGEDSKVKVPKTLIKKTIIVLNPKD